MKNTFEIDCKNIFERDIAKMALVYRLMVSAKDQDLKLFNKFRNLLKKMISDTSDNYEVGIMRLKIAVKCYADLNLSPNIKPISGYIDGVARNDTWVDENFDPRFDLLPE